jgi:hypothetical protein
MTVDFFIQPHRTNTARKRHPFNLGKILQEWWPNASCKCKTAIHALSPILSKKEPPGETRWGLYPTGCLSAGYFGLHGIQQLTGLVAMTQTAAGSGSTLVE